MPNPNATRRVTPYVYLAAGLLLIAIGVITNDRVWTGMAWFGGGLAVTSLLWLAVRHGL